MLACSTVRNGMGDEKDALAIVLDGVDATFNGLDAVAIVGKVRAKLQERSPTTRIKEAMEIEGRSFAAKRDAETAKRLAALEASASDQRAFREAVTDMVCDRQFWTLQANLEWEAARSTLADRREMLAYAAAELSLPGMPIEDKALIERTLRNLDTRDVLLLRRLAGESDLSPSLHSGNRGWSNLVSAGCLDLSGGGAGMGVQAQVSWLGRQVLQVLGTYAPEAKS
jgi:hypothetical protein